LLIAPTLELGGETVKESAMAILAAGLLLALITPVQAYHCPLLVKECRALVEKLEKKGKSDAMTLAKAKQGCEDAQKLHEAGKHKDSVIKAGEAISLAGESVK
jgi:hypothetical protein